VRIVRKSDLAHQNEAPTRGWAHIGFDDYPPMAPGRLDFGPLKLFAEGYIHAGEGFDMHRHEGVENVLLVLDGCIEHRGSDGSHWHLERDHVFLMSAGSGGEHQEYARGDTMAHALVLWLESDEPEAPCRFSRRSYIPSEGWTTLASGREHRSGGLELHRDAAVLRADLEPSSTITHELEAGRRGYLIAVDGSVEVDGQRLEAGERAMIEGPGIVRMTAVHSVTLVLVDMDR
jgi:redox-sensitive bicupin YhaK (pirin superfamily)